MTELYTTGGVSLRVWDTTGRMVFGPPDTSIQTEPAQPAEPVELVRRVIAGDTWRTGRVNTGRATPKTYFSEHNVYANAKALQLTYGGNLPDGVTMDVAASIQRQGDPSSRMVATFGGATTATLTGPAQLVTDDIPLAVSAGDRIEVLTYYGARSDGLAHPAAPGGWYGAEILDGNQVATGAPRIANSRAFDGGAGYRPAMPHKITGLADPATISWLIGGDSITESGSPARTQVGAYPSIAHQYTYSSAAAKSAGIPSANIGLWASSFPAGGRTGPHWSTIPSLEGFTHVTTAWGFNDLNLAQATGGTEVKVMASAVETWKWMLKENPALKIWQTTISPSSTSTDKWATLEGQTPVASAPLRRAFNAWVRDGAPLIAGAPAAPGSSGALRAGQEGHPLAGYVEVADTVMSARDSEIFRVDHGALTDDGGHPNETGHRLMRTPMDALVASWRQGEV